MDLPLRAVKRGAVQCLLLPHFWKSRGEHELKFGAKQSDRYGAGFGDMLQVDEKPGVHVQIDRNPVLVTAATLRSLRYCSCLFARSRAFSA